LLCEAFKHFLNYRVIQLEKSDTSLQLAKLSYCPPTVQSRKKVTLLARWQSLDNHNRESVSYRLLMAL
jgi:hypothetical protein